MSTIKCERCGNPMNYEDSYIMKIEHRGRTECTFLCKSCADLTKQFTEPAYIPGYSKTRYDILCNQMQARLEISPKDQIREWIKNMNGKKSITKIAQELGLTTECIMLIMKEQEGDE